MTRRPAHSLLAFALGQSDLGSTAALVAVAAAAVPIGCGGTAWPAEEVRWHHDRPAGGLKALPVTLA